MTRRLRFGLTLLLLCLLPLSSGCQESRSSSGVHVTDFRYVKLPNGNREFTGTVVNQGERRYSVVQVEVALYGTDGQRTGMQQIEVDDVPPGSTRAFRTRVKAQTSIRRARVRSVWVP